MKMGVEHRVPLSNAALTALAAVRPLRTSSTLVFPSPVKPGKEIDAAAMAKVLKRIYGDRCTMHGFRAAFRSWAAETTSYPHAVCEMALAHRVGGDIVLSYQRSDLFEKRRALMDAWAAYVTGDGAKVLQFHAP